jgi:hypothetical protein
MPTRLGNLTYEYELYPNCKYGLDSVFFFYRTWVSIDKDLRDELDRKQASVDGAFYLSFVLALAALWFFGWFWILLAADSYGESAQVLSPWLLGKRIEFAWALPTWVNSPLSGIYLVLPYGVYRLSLYGPRSTANSSRRCSTSTARACSIRTCLTTSPRRPATAASAPPISSRRTERSGAICAGTRCGSPGRTRTAISKPSSPHERPRTRRRGAHPIAAPAHRPLTRDHSRGPT